MAVVLQHPVWPEVTQQFEDGTDVSDHLAAGWVQADPSTLPGAPAPSQAPAPNPQPATQPAPQPAPAQPVQPQSVFTPQPGAEPTPGQ